MNITPKMIDYLLSRLGVVAARAGAIRRPSGGIEAAFMLPHMSDTLKVDDLVQWDNERLFDTVAAPVRRLQTMMLDHLREHMDVGASDIELISAQADKLVNSIAQHLGKLAVPYDVAAAITMETIALKDLITRVRDGKQRVSVRQPDKADEARAEPEMSASRTTIPPG